MKKEKTILFIIFTVIITAAITVTFLKFIDANSGKGNTGTIKNSSSANKDLNFYSESENKEIIDDLMFGKNGKPIMALLIFSFTSIAYFGFKKYEKFYAVILFGLFLGTVIAFFHNSLCIMTFRNFNFFYGFENQLLGAGAGLISSLLILIYQAFIEFLKILPEEHISLKQWIFEKYSTPNIRLAFSSLRLRFAVFVVFFILYSIFVFNI